MHIARLGLRPLLVLAAALAAVLFVVINFGSSSPHTASAVNTFNPAGVICINIDFDFPPGGAIEQANAVEILARVDHQKNDLSDTNFTMSTVAYVGDANNDGVPDTSLSNCATKGTGGEPFALPGTIAPPYQSVDPWKRADVKATVVASPHAITWSTCSNQGPPFNWVYTVFNFPLAANQKDFGTSTTGTNDSYLSTVKCTTDVSSPGFVIHYASPARASQRAIENKGTGVVTAAPGTSGGLNWDGDINGTACTDWLELSADKNERRGVDPFNPTDCTATIAPNTAGILSAVFDIQDCNTPNCTLTSILYHCISRQDHDTTTNMVTSAAVCNDNTGGLGAANGLPLQPPAGEGHLGDANAAGPPPPPPYTTAAPALGNGQYCPAGPTCTFDQNGDGTDETVNPDSLVVRSCFPNVGGNAGPNYVAVVHDGDAFDIAANPAQGGPAADLAALKFDVARVELFTKQSIGECSSKSPGGSPFLVFNIKLTAPGATTNAEYGGALCNPTCFVSPLRTGHPGATATDYDGDGCTDKDELASPNPKGKCGDDPYNPLDPTGTPLDCSGAPNPVTLQPANCLSGAYDIVATVVRADCQRVGAACNLIPGYYYSCIADIQQNVKALDAHASCYIDSPSFVNNKPATANYVMAGTVTKSSTSMTVVGSGTTFLSELAVNDMIKVSGPLAGDKSETKTVTAVNTDTDITVNSVFSNDASGKTITRITAHNTCPFAEKKFCGDGLAGSPQPGCSQSSQVPSVPCLALPAASPSRHDCAGLGTSPDPQVPCDVSQWQLIHVDKSAHLVGSVNNTTNEVSLDGCFEDPNGQQALGAVYIQATFDAHSGHGFVTLWSFQTNAACLTAATSHDPTPLVQVFKSTIKASIVRQPPGEKPPAATTLSAPIVTGDLSIPVALLDGLPTSGTIVIGGTGQEVVTYTGKSAATGPGNLTGATRGQDGTNAGPHAAGVSVTLQRSRDSDSDGCPDKREMLNPAGAQTNLDAAKLGGLRDPQNPFDYPDMPLAANKHMIRVDDVAYVVNRYRHNMNLLPVPGTNAYDPRADHTVLLGNNAGQTWHLGPPDGQITVADVTAVVNQYRHDCIP